MIHSINLMMIVIIVDIVGDIMDIVIDIILMDIVGDGLSNDLGMTVIDRSNNNQATE